MLLLLPAELQLAVCAHLDGTSAAAVARTCRALHDPAERALYATLDPVARPTLAEAVRPRQHGLWRAPARLAALLRALRARPARAGYVRRLHLVVAPYTAVECAALLALVDPADALHLESHWAHDDDLAPVYAAATCRPRHTRCVRAPMDVPWWPITRTLLARARAATLDKVALSGAGMGGLAKPTLLGATRLRSLRATHVGAWEAEVVLAVVRASRGLREIHVDWPYGAKYLPAALLAELREAGVPPPRQ